jgi:nicotinamide-nucleotide amidase
MNTTHSTQLALCGALANELTRLGWCMACAESCTGGLIAATCTGLSGSSAWFERGFVTYSNAAKTELLGVPTPVIEAHGAVSDVVAQAMVRGAIAHSAAQAGVAVTGIAGPTGGSADKPVGTVWLAWAVGAEVWSECQHFAGDRDAVRQATVQHALNGLLLRLRDTPNPPPLI